MKTKQFVTRMALSCLLMLPCSMQAATVDVQYLVLTQTDGTVHKFALHEAPVITFSGSSMIVTCGEQVLQTDMAGISNSGYVTEQVSTGIDRTELSEKPRNPVFAFGQAKFEGMAPGSRIAVYTLDGKMVAFTHADAEGKANVCLTALQRGIYVLRTPTRNYKISK